MKKEELIQLMDQHLDWYPQYGIDGKEALAIAIISKLKELAVEKKM